MKTFLLGAFCFAAGMLAVSCYHQTGTPVFADGQPDPAKVERFLRHFYAWPADAVTVKIAPYKQAGVPGFLETTVDAGPKNGKGDAVTQGLLISADGRFLFESTPLRMDGDPFRGNRDQIDVRNQPSFGSPTPKITIVEYGDLQCSYCKAVVSVLRQDIPREFGRDVRIIFKDFPIYEIHPWAWDAAASGRCIYKQNPATFWEYHDWAYDQQGRLTPELYKKAVAGFAAAKKLDTTKLNACLADPETRMEIDRELQEAKALKVTGTPAFFINGRKVEGSQSFGAMKQFIQSELEYLNAK